MINENSRIVPFGGGACGIGAKPIANDEVVRRAILNGNARATALDAINGQSFDHVIVAYKGQAMMIIYMGTVNLNLVIALRAINHHAVVIGDVRQVILDSNRMKTLAGDVENNQVKAGTVVGVDQRPAQRSGRSVGIVAGISRFCDDEGTLRGNAKQRV